MVTDEMLQDAAAEAEHFLLTSLQRGNRCQHVFSVAFEKKMNKLIRRAEHPFRYNFLRTVAAILITIATLFGAIFTLSPETRANVISWIKNTFQEFFQYSNNGTSEPIVYEYVFEEIPDGYRELNSFDREDGQTQMYVNGAGDILQFTYAYGAITNSVFIKTENCTQSSGLVNGISADIYLTSQENETNAIIWHDPDTDTLLCINAKADQNTLIAIAESVSKREKEKT